MLKRGKIKAFNLFGKNSLWYPVPHDHSEGIASRKLDGCESESEGGVVGFICPGSDFSATCTRWEKRINMRKQLWKKGSPPGDLRFVVAVHSKDISGSSRLGSTFRERPKPGSSSYFLRHQLSLNCTISLSFLKCLAWLWSSKDSFYDRIGKYFC